jgi:hypothetical protein
MQTYLSGQMPHEEVFTKEVFLKKNYKSLKFKVFCYYLFFGAICQKVSLHFWNQHKSTYLLIPILDYFKKKKISDPI